MSDDDLKSTEGAQRVHSEPNEARTASSSLPGLTFAQYNEHVVASGISWEVAKNYGVRGIGAVQAIGFGFHGEQARDGVLFPLHWDDWESPILHQLRPFVSRVASDGKPVKYETPKRATTVLSTMPSTIQAMKNPRVPLLFTEGVKKMLAWETKRRRLRVEDNVHFGRDAARRSVPCPAVINLMGVHGWLGANEDGGRGVPLAAIREMPFRGRDEETGAEFRRLVILAFDSDAMTKPQVHAALTDLHGYLTSRRADVWVMYLPSGKDGAKVGLDDFLAAGHTIEDALNLCEPKLRPLTGDALGARPFRGYTVGELQALRGEEPGVSWVVHGYLARGHVTLLSAAPKVGKTTLAFELAEAISKGKESVIGCAVAPGVVFHVDLEMGETLTVTWAQRYGLNACDCFLTWSGTRAQIPGDVHGIRAEVQRKDVSVLVVDSFAKWTLGHVESEADNLQLIAQVQQLKRIAVEHNVAVLIIHHLRKAPGSFTEVIRGGGGIFAEVDIAINMHAVAKDFLSDPRRKLEALGRFMEVTLPARILTRKEGHYVAEEATADSTLAGPAGIKWTQRMWDALSVLAELTHPIKHPDAYTSGVQMKEWKAGMRRSFENDSIVPKARTPGIELDLVVEDGAGNYGLGPKGVTEAVARKWWPGDY